MTEQTAPVTAAVPEIKDADDLNTRIGQFIAIRDLLKEFDDKTAQDRKKLSGTLEQLNGMIQRFMDTHKLENMSTANGTAYKSSRTTASLADPAAFMNYVISHQQWDLLDRRANSTACKAFAEEHKALPPGVNLSTVESVNIRRKSGGGKDE